VGGGELRSNESPEIWVELVDSAKSGAMIKKGQWEGAKWEVFLGRSNGGETRRKRGPTEVAYWQCLQQLRGSNKAKLLEASARIQSDLGMNIYQFRRKTCLLGGTPPIFDTLTAITGAWPEPAIKPEWAGVASGR
jgi:hypothetical protein